MSRKFIISCLLLSIAPAAAGAASGPPAPAEDEQIRGELTRLLGELDSESYEARREAAAAVEQLMTRPELAGLLAGEFGRMLIRPDVSFEVRWHLQRWTRRLPPLPPEAGETLSAEDLNRVIEQLDDDSYSVRLATLRRLRWLLGRDEHVPLLQRAIQLRLKRPIDPAVVLPGDRAQLRKLLELTRPAMVAEYWRGGHHLAEQHLLIGVPSLGEGAQRPSHFDRIDDKTAHCASGNNLSPGDYPVGVAFPHPSQPGAFFQLVNLSTPRRRMAYARHVQTDEAGRLAALSRRTLDRMLADRRRLDRSELMMLGQLDSKEVSRFAGKYFHLFEDRQLPLPADCDDALPSQFGMICAQLATSGTKEAMPGLLDAIDKNAFLPPTSAAPYQFHWVAALAIAIRDPWPEVDTWLAGKISRTDVPVAGRAEGPELGATAAAILLTRHGESPPQFGLQPAVEPLLLRLRIEGYRFSSPEARKAVGQWWEKQRSKPDKDTARE